MRKLIISIILIIVVLISPAAAYQSLQALYDTAQPQNGYDKYIELDPAIEYEGDLLINSPDKICLMGNGAKIFGRPYLMSVSVVYAHLDILECTFIGGGYGIYYVLDSYGSISNNTIINCSEQGIATIYFDEDRGLEIFNNIITGSNYGFLCIENHHPSYLGFNTIWDAGTYRYAEQCLD